MMPTMTVRQWRGVLEYLCSRSFKDLRSSRDGLAIAHGIEWMDDDLAMALTADGHMVVAFGWAT